ncbi:hypothetical protein E3T46_13820 [Cryobacterium sp. Hh11]|nr:hypothetical protein E3T46_13820 [Cryobacterium sp. Hh11]
MGALRFGWGFYCAQPNLSKASQPPPPPAADAQAAADAKALAAQRAAEQPYVAPCVAPAVPSVDNYTGCRAYGNNGTFVDNKGSPRHQDPLLLIESGKTPYFGSGFVLVT